MELGSHIGRYTVLARIGRGGMGEVYAAYDPELDRKVALKLLRAGASDDRERAQGRLLREAKAMARLSHRNVVAVHDVGTFEGRVYLTMEYVDGLTLTAWLAERPRGRDEILSVFLAAARGLVAAHAAGLVHRDFKPGNVMVARDGSVRVTDFGLARSLDAGVDDEPSHAPVPRRDPRLTQTGALLGTPRYMAPEQFAGRPADARTDQFSFCVALYRAVYRAAPFPGATFETLAAAVLAGRVEPAPAKATVPAWLRRVVVRGLSVDPAARWPSMERLVAALARDPARTRRRWTIAAGALGLVGLSILAVARGAESKVPLCLAGPQHLAGVWGVAGVEPRPRRDAVERAFLASGAPDARDVWDRAASLLDRYRDRWLSMYREACEATNVRHQQSTALLDLRMSCLDERRQALAALTGVLAAADRDVVTNAVAAANALPPLDPCADREQLEAPVEVMPDEATARKVAELRTRAAVAKALNDAGKHNESAAMIRQQLVEARATHYRTLIAETLVAFSRCCAMGNYQAGLSSVLEEALWTALAVGRDELAAEAAVELVPSGYDGARPDEGQRGARLANAVLDRAGPGHDLQRAWLLANEGDLEYQQHHAEAALALFRRAQAIKERVLPADHPDIALSLNNVANALDLLGRDEEALAISRRVQTIFLRSYGPSSTELAISRSNSAEYLVALGRPAEALDPARRALAGWQGQVGPNHHYLGYPLTVLGRALVDVGRPAEALAPLERALRLREAGEPDPSMVAETRFALARALWAANADRGRARALASLAQAAYAKAGETKHATDIAAWLANPGGTGSARP